MDVGGDFTLLYSGAKKKKKKKKKKQVNNATHAAPRRPGVIRGQKWKEMIWMRDVGCARRRHCSVEVYYRH